MKSNANWDDLIDAKEASELFKKDASYFRYLVKEEKLTENVDCKKFGKTWVFSKKSLEKYFKK